MSARLPDRQEYRLVVRLPPTRATGDFAPYATADFAAELLVSLFGRFLLPGGRPRLLILDIQAGGRPRRLPRPRARRSNVMIASSICSRSARKSANILLMSIP